MPGFKIDQQKGGTVLTMAALVPSVKFNGTISPREVRAKLDWPTPVSVGFIFHRIGVSICHS